MKEVTQTSKVKYGGVLKRCDCQSEFQDKEYGKGMRVHSLCKQGEEARCCTCLKTIKAKQ